MTKSLSPLNVNLKDNIFPETLGHGIPLNRLKGRHILVVGAGQRKIQDVNPPMGNGKAISILFAREGATVCCLDVNAEAADATVAQIRSEGGKAVPYVFDVRDAEGISRAVGEVKGLLGGRLDGMVLVVGISKGLSLGDLTKEAWDDNFAVNLTSHMLFSQQGVLVMEPGSAIVVLSSMANERANGGNPAYEASKAGQLALVRAVARAGEGRGVRCCGIAPGYVDTPMGRDASRRSKGRAQNVPFGRQATAWEIAYPALFLMSREASYINAASICVDGGVSVGVLGREKLDIDERGGLKL